MADKIRCRECWYCVETPFKHRHKKQQDTNDLHRH